MASQPVKRDMVGRMAQLALEADESLPPDLDPDTAALHYLTAYLESGGRLSRLAQQLQCSRFLLTRWIKGNKEREAEYIRARASGADALVDEGGDLLDSATRDTIAVANARAGWRKWLASKYDPTTYGEGQASQVSIGSLHLHAALSRPPIQGNAPPALGPMPGAVERGYLTGSEAHPTESKALGTGEIVVEPPSKDSGEQG